MKIEEIFSDHGFFIDWRQGSGFGTEVFPMEYTPFFYQGFFHGMKNEKFKFVYAKRQFETLFFHYLKNYQSKNEVKAQLVDAVINFVQNFDSEEILNKILGGENYFDLKVPLDGTIFRMKRMGDALGFQIRSGNGNDDIHQAGTEFMKKSCYPGDSRPWREFIKRIVFTIPVVKKDVANNVSQIDLNSTIIGLKYFCHGIEWKYFTDIPQQLINEYTANYADKVFNGEAGGVQRWLKLVHLDRGKKEVETEAQYRKGNVSKVKGSPGVWEFMAGRNIFLQIGLDCMIKDTFCYDQIPFDINTSERQTILRKWAMAMQGQLYAMLVSEDFNKNE